MKIAVLGAQGYFGSRILARLRSISPGGVEIVGTQTREESVAVVTDADLVVIAVKADDTEGLLQLIKFVLKPGAVICSFCANVSIEKIAGIVNKVVVRGMADPFWHLGAFIFLDVREEIKELLKSMSRSTFEYSKDTEIDNFTYWLSYVYVVLCMSLTKELSSEERMREVQLAQKHLAIGEKLIQEIEISLSDPSETLKNIMTKGGVSAEIYRNLKLGSNLLKGN